jgi:hypothetical protein
MIDTNKIRYFLDEIDELNRKLEQGSNAWQANEDPLQMSQCDPGIQFEIGCNIDELWHDLRCIINENVL